MNPRLLPLDALRHLQALLRRTVMGRHPLGQAPLHNGCCLAARPKLQKGHKIRHFPQAALVQPLQVLCHLSLRHGGPLIQDLIFIYGEEVPPRPSCEAGTSSEDEIFSWSRFNACLLGYNTA